MINDAAPVHQQPVVTVVTVVFNDAEGISRTIESVAGQTYDSVEHIVVDGKSQDGTAQKVEESRDLIDVYLSEPDRGIYDEMNKAIGHATGKFLLVMKSGGLFFTQSQPIKYN